MLLPSAAGAANSTVRAAGGGLAGWSEAGGLQVGALQPGQRQGQVQLSLVQAGLLWGGSAQAGFLHKRLGLVLLRLLQQQPGLAHVVCAYPFVLE